MSMYPRPPYLFTFSFVSLSTFPTSMTQPPLNNESSLGLIISSSSIVIPETTIDSKRPEILGRKDVLHDTLFMCHSLLPSSCDGTPCSNEGTPVPVASVIGGGRRPFAVSYSPSCKTLSLQSSSLSIIAKAASTLSTKYMASIHPINSCSIFFGCQGLCPGAPWGAPHSSHFWKPFGLVDSGIFKNSFFTASFPPNAIGSSKYPSST
eukprot:CCRYP_007523-RF/>CCRYP_007523-RF protein AED:0.22 eAED:0.23 QI:1702/0.66/0.5/1/0.66/0.25/4/1042/206